MTRKPLAGLTQPDGSTVLIFLLKSATYVAEIIDPSATKAKAAIVKVLRLAFKFKAWSRM